MPGEAWAVAQRKRLDRRDRFRTTFYEKSGGIRALFLLVGLVWLLAIPTEHLIKQVWVDEHALQPNSVNTHWGMQDVHTADRYLESLESMKDANASRAEMSQFIVKEFRKIGVAVGEQRYVIDASSKISRGTNIYASLSAPRASASEALVISASWESREFAPGSLTQRQGNLRGIALLLALAKQTKGYSLWAKDLVFVVSDGYLEGMHAFLSVYHGSESPGLQADSLPKVNGGVIWTALCLDYPGHSFSEIGMFYEGVNGRLPNQDLLNSLAIIIRYTGNVPIILYDYNADELRMKLTSSLPSAVRNSWVAEYALRAMHVLRHVGFQARGQPSGVHGLFHQYRIDAVTLFAVPAWGPHGFHAFGRILESSMRTMNNLQERLHASFFFYLFTGADHFLAIGKYLTAAVLIGINLELNGLHGWVASGWRFDEASKRWHRIPRPILVTLGIMLATHIAGAFYFSALTSGAMSIYAANIFGVTLYILTASFIVIAVRKTSAIVAPVSSLLRSLTLCIGGTIVCVTSVLNFSLAAVLALALAFALSHPFAPSSHQKHIIIRKITKAGMISLVAPPITVPLLSLWFGASKTHLVVEDAVWGWNVLRIWSLPLICCVYFPFVLQAMIATIL